MSIEPRPDSQGIDRNPDSPTFNQKVNQSFASPSPFVHSPNPPEPYGTPAAPDTHVHDNPRNVSRSTPTVPSTPAARPSPTVSAPGLDPLAPIGSIKKYDPKVSYILDSVVQVDNVVYVSLFDGNLGNLPTRTESAWKVSPVHKVKVFPGQQQPEPPSNPKLVRK